MKTMFKLHLTFEVDIFLIPEAVARCLVAVLPAFRLEEGSVQRWWVSHHDHRAWGRLEAQPLAPGHFELSVGVQLFHSDLRHTNVKRVDKEKSLS